MMVSKKIIMNETKSLELKKIFKNVNEKEIKNFNGNEIHMRIFEEAILNNSFCLDKAIF